MEFLRMAAEKSERSVENGGGPFGAVIVKNDEVLAVESNSVTIDNDPTAHAEVNAIRSACRKVGSFKLDGCYVYSSCEPCPMCLSAIYWSGIKKIYYGNTAADADDINFGDKFIYDEIALPKAERSVPSIGLMRLEAQKAFRNWRDKTDKIEY